MGRMGLAVSRSTRPRVLSSANVKSVNRIARQPPNESIVMIPQADTRPPIRGVSLWIGVFVFMLGAVGVVFSMAVKPQSPSDDDLFLASGAQRELNQQQVRDLLVSICANGYEKDSAGVYLIRPVNDPMWGPDYGEGVPSGGHHWFYAKPYYKNVQYQDRVPPGFTINWGPGDNQPIDCCITFSRIFSNRMMSSITVVPELGSKFGVRADFSPRAVGALRTLISDRRVTAGVEFTDWFDITHPIGTAPTEMRVAVVSDNYMYLPFRVQDIVGAGPGPVTVQLASELTEHAANVLRDRLLRP